MNTPKPTSSNVARTSGDWLDALLVQDAHDASYIDDDGFTAGVMRSLPAPAVLPAWRKPIVMLLWLVAGVLVAAMLPQALQDVAREAVRYVAAKPVSLSMLATLLVVLGVATGAGTAVALRRD
ncbi:MAG TPA: hypothetical protein VGL43_02320 [Casimicrobiaceae bacterium]|jgi:hypothetical protein|nr:hypothetical protein [Casimicrobiaceae bacterium]